jgi:predicted DNA repair protein MutK
LSRWAVYRLLCYTKNQQNIRPLGGPHLASKRRWATKKVSAFGYSKPLMIGNHSVRHRIFFLSYAAANSQILPQSTAHIKNNDGPVGIGQPAN